MTTSKYLFLANLSMDAYNRGYGAGIGDGAKLMRTVVILTGLVRPVSSEPPAFCPDPMESAIPPGKPSASTPSLALWGQVPTRPPNCRA